MATRKEDFWNKQALDCCGCCGREIGETQIWCADCDRHIAKHGELWDRTYWAQYGKACPFQTKSE